METEFTRTDGTELTKHDVFTHTSHSVSLRKCCRFHKDIDGFLKRASHQRTSFRAVNTVTCDGHQVTSIRHYLDENRQVSVVDVRTVEFDNASEFFQQRVSHGFDTEDGDHFHEMVRGSSREINIWVRHDFEQVASFRIEHPLRVFFKSTRGFVELGGICFADEHFLNVRNTSQSERG